MGAPDHYFIKDGYCSNQEPVTVDAVSGSVYWSPHRIRGNRSFQYGVYRYASRLVREHGIRTVIDVGCGAGYKLGLVARRNPNTRVVGIDQPNAIEYCRSHNDFGEWHADDFESPSDALADLRAELVISSDVIEHLSDPDNLLRYIRLRLRPGGWVLLSTPERDALRGRDCRHSPNPNHIREWNFDEFEAYLTSRGAEIVDHFVQYPVRIAPNRLFYRHVVKRWLAGKPLKSNQVCLLRWTEAPGTR